MHKTNVVFTFYFSSSPFIILIVFISYFCISYHRQEIQQREDCGTDLSGSVLLIMHTEGNSNNGK